VSQAIVALYEFGGSRYASRSPALLWYRRPSARVTACLRQVHEDGQVTTEVREFATTYEALLALSEWLATQHCSVVAMEGTGYDEERYGRLQPRQEERQRKYR